MATAHLICGPVGAGKTTRARAIAAEQRAVLFCLDEWMVTLYGEDMPRPLRMDWAMPRAFRCDAQIWRVARRLLELGVDVVLDLGFARREHRDRYRALVAEAGAEVRLHVVTADAAVRRERVLWRNLEPGGTFTMEVTDPLFDWAEKWYQPPGSDE